jgi:hypothetical protein
MSMTQVRVLVAVTGLFVLGWCALSDEPAKKPAEPGTLTVVDVAGKEHRLKAWRFVEGTQRLGWLAPAKKPGAEGDAPAGPEALVVRDETKIHFLAGVVTLVPLDRLRTVAFDAEKETMTVRSSTGPKETDAQVLTGTTSYKGINKVALEADVDKGAAGVASVTFRGGVAKGGIREVRFPPPKTPPAPAGRPAVVVSADGSVRRTHVVHDLLPLYRLASGEVRLVPTLMFKKTLKIDVSHIKKISVSGDETDETAWQVVQKDGDDSTLTLLNALPIDGKPAQLAGLVGRVPAGYKLFPVRRIAEVHFDTTEESKEKGKEKEKKEKDGEDKPKLKSKKRDG